ncbi:class A beta-lactamase [Streptomyces sp. UNOC14_S4]|uniref:class A beta-lactamase n=1 Tax=Streptomyces sp. UNOC14_S4 TaxID=2872340 RepID=UPI001E52A56C|nr:class A beta-lactamase [Streptomyces sp. UNOC14_S4]MCC3773018.1 class A beta-lactamase [Streptomyces sp. UNOC14_S4]
MVTTGAHPTRRAVLALGAGTALAGVVSTGGAAHAATPRPGGISGRLRELEQEHSARLGVFAHDTGTGRTVLYRADERFPMCSVFKTLAVAAVLRDLDHNGEFLAKRVRYTAEYVKASGWDRITGEEENVANGMTVEELCDAAIRFSDNGAANLLLDELHGPETVTRFCRSVGDRTTRLDRREPELNSAEPWRETDVTSPRAIGGTYERLVLGDVLDRRDRARLTGWLRGNTTGTDLLRKGLPADWTVGDKTGAGSYGTRNDVGIAWPPGRAPIVLAVLTTKREQDAKTDDPLVAKAAELVATALS